MTRHRLLVRLLQVTLLATMLLLWQYMASGSKTLLLTVSTPADVARWIWDWATGGPEPHGSGWPDLLITVKTAAFGYAAGAVAGVVAGTVIGGVRGLRRFVAPFVGLLNAFPKIALAPLFVVIFGASVSMQVYFVAASVCFITFYAIYHGIQDIDPLFLQQARMLGAGRAWRVRSVYIPSTAGWLISGLRLTATWAIAATVVVEYLTSGQGGMGLVVSTGQSVDNIPEVIGGIVIVSAFAFLVDQILIAANRRATRWRTEGSAG